MIHRFLLLHIFLLLTFQLFLKHMDYVNEKFKKNIMSLRDYF